MPETQTAEIPTTVFHTLPEWEQQRIVRRVDFRFPGREIVWGWQRIGKVAGVDHRTAKAASEGRIWPKSHATRPTLRVFFRPVPRSRGRLMVGAELCDVLTFRKEYFGLPSSDCGTTGAGARPVTTGLKSGSRFLQTSTLPNTPDPIPIA